MTRFASIIAGAALAAMAAVPAAAQYQYPYPQPYPQPGPQYPYPGQNYGNNYGNDESVIGSIVDGLIGNRYAVGDRQAIRQCAWAAVQRAQGQYGGGYGQGYRDRPRVTSINDVQRRTLVLRIRGTLGRGGSGGYGNGYNNGYGGGYGGGGYARPELSFRCDVNYNGYVQNVRIEPLGRAY